MYQRHASIVQTMSPPDKALLRPLGSFSNKDHTMYPHFATLHLLEAIKGACRDRSTKNDTTTQHDTRADNSPRPCEGTMGVTHTLSTHTLRPGSSSLSHPLVTPTTSTLVQDNTEHRAFQGLNQYNSPMFFLHTIWISDAQTHITRWC
jgi:hypothetical protein